MTYYHGNQTLRKGSTCRVGIFAGEGGGHFLEGNNDVLECRKKKGKNKL